jgi:hypothetical protein
MTEDMKGWMDFEEAIQWVMKRTGKNHRQAEAALKERCRQGLISCRGTNSRTGWLEAVPPEVFAEH